MGNKLDKMVSQLKEGVDSLVKEQLPVDSLVKKLRGQDCGCTNSGDGDAGDLSAVCGCVVGKSCGCDFQDEKRDNDCCDDLNEMYRIERKETNEEIEVCYVPEAFVPVVPITSTLTEVCYVPEADVPVVPVTSTLTEVCYVPEADVPVVPVTSTLTEVCYVPEADVPVVPVTSTSMSLTEQDNVGSAFKPVAMDLKDLCLSVGAHEGNSKLDNSIQKFSMNCTCGASHIEFRCQENHQQRICTSTIIIDIGIDECQSDYSKSEPSRGRHVPLETEETCILDVKLLSEDDCGALDFVCNVAASEPAAPLRGVCLEGLLRQRVRSTAVLKKTVLDPISFVGCDSFQRDKDIVTACHQMGSRRGLLFRENIRNFFSYNIFCDICITGKYPIFFPPNYNFSKCWKREYVPKLSFSMVLNFRPKEETDVGSVFVKQKCLDKQWPAPNGRCLELNCTPGKHLKGDTCVEILEEIDGHGLGYTFTYFLMTKYGSPEELSHHFKNEQSIKRSTRLLLTQLNIYLFVASFSYYLEVNIAENPFLCKSYQRKAETSVVFSVKVNFYSLIRESRTQLETRLIAHLLKKDFKLTLSETVEVPLQPSVVFIQYQSFKKRGLWNMYRNSGDRYVGLKLLSLSSLMLCKYVSFNATEYQLTVNDTVTPPDVSISIDFNVTKIIIKDNKDLILVKVTDEGILNVCVDLLDRILQESERNSKKSGKECIEKNCLIEYILTLTCFSLSALCLLLTMLSYLMISKLRTMTGLNNFFLSCSLLLAQLSSLASIR
ncbi:adhesion G protein-coupled receptor E4P, partial [Biomphalaria glabrata]